MRFPCRNLILTCPRMRRVSASDLALLQSDKMMYELSGSEKPSKINILQTVSVHSGIKMDCLREQRLVVGINADFLLNVSSAEQM